MGKVLDVLERSWPITRRLMHGHTLMYRWSGGRLGHSFRRIAPWSPPFLILEHVGAKSGIRREAPLVYAPNGDHPILIASKGGHPRNPAWYHNLMAHPDTWVQIGRERRAVHARLATPEERPELWRTANAVWKHFDDYQAHTERQIPVIVLDPREP